MREGEEGGSESPRRRRGGGQEAGGGCRTRGGALKQAVFGGFAAFREPRNPTLGK